MEDIIKLAAVSLISAVLYVVVKQLRPDYAVFVQICSVSAVSVFAVSYAADIIAAALAMTEFSGTDTYPVKILIKSLGIAIVTQLAGDVCRDNGNSALASGVELAGRFAIIALSLPLIRQVAELAAGLINS